MSDANESVRKTLADALSGKGAHVRTVEVFDGLSWEPAGERPEGAPHSVFQLLNHIVYWQDFALEWLDGKKPATPEHAEDSWPGGVSPDDGEAWESAVERFKAGLAEVERRAAESDLYVQLGPKSATEIVQLIASHNSYHAGQVASVRRALDAWPPPGGGETW